MCQYVECLLSLLILLFYATCWIVGLLIYDVNVVFFGIYLLFNLIVVYIRLP